MRQELDVERAARTNAEQRLSELNNLKSQQNGKITSLQAEITKLSQELKDANQLNHGLKAQLA